MKYKTFDDIVDGTPTKKVYKYSRKQLADRFQSFYYGNRKEGEFIKDFLATTDKPNCQHNRIMECKDYTECQDCGKVLFERPIQSQPKTKPCGCVKGVMNCNECLEPMSYKSQPKIEKIKRLLVITNFGEDETLYRKVNELIDAVNKLNSK